MKVVLQELRGSKLLCQARMTRKYGNYVKCGSIQPLYSIGSLPSSKVEH
jgi:hypothetical protein